MKKVLILSIRKNTDTHIRALEAEYVKRCRRDLKIDIEDIRQRYTAQEKSDIILKKESELFEAKIPKGCCLIALHESGKTLSSTEFAEWLNRLIQPLVFLIGSPYGLHPALRDQAQMTLSLSTMTLTHEHARLLLLEQLYRATDLWHNGPYHK